MYSHLLFAELEIIVTIFINSELDTLGACHKKYRLRIHNRNIDTFISFEKEKNLSSISSRTHLFDSFSL